MVVEPRREEEAERHQKDEMPWGWDLHEMRNAAMMDDVTSSETLEALHPTPAVSGFTPINFSELSSTDPADENAAVEATAADNARLPKRRKTQSCAATAGAKPKKAAKSRTAKRTKTAAQLGARDISHGLPRTKPTPPKGGALHAKEKPNAITSLRNLRSRRIDDTPLESHAMPDQSDITGSHQIAYPNGRSNVITRATPPTPPKSDDFEAQIVYSDEFHDQDSVTNRQAGENNHTAPSAWKSLEVDDSIITRDFGAPPFTQSSPPTLRCPKTQSTIMPDDFEPLDLRSDDFYEMRDIDNGDHGGEDEFPMDSECFEEIIQSDATLVEEQDLNSDREPQDASDDLMFIGRYPEEDQLHWPEALPNSDGMIMYDEDPTLVASDTVDAPSPVQASSQASGILTPITGNAKPDRARTAQGSENCFDEDDLNDTLIDLTVDEPKSLQNPSPSAHAKQSSSPKLQWLSPKTYTPAKSTQIPTYCTSDPHVVPESSAGHAPPFMRPPFPKAVRDRSPILGLSNRSALRICFRIGEALNAAAVASRTNVDAIIELYARVVTSSREASGGYKQFFQFGDLFTDKPPHLSGTYTFWKGVGLWDHDSKELAGEQGKGKMVRVLGRIKRKETVQGQGPGVEMAVLSIWEVDWEDVGIAKGMVCFEEG